MFDQLKSTILSALGLPRPSRVPCTSQLVNTCILLLFYASCNTKGHRVGCGGNRKLPLCSWWDSRKTPGGCVLETTAQFDCLIEKTTAPGLETRKSSGPWVGNKITLVLFEKTKGLRGKILGIGMMLGIHSKSQHRQQSTA